ncbi:MAG: hypothetical protein Q9168_006119 [Polycauliona sp. 1 TL-2023]
MSAATATALRSAWAEVLDVDTDEIEDDSNFVALGGDSVMAMKLANIAPSYGLDLDTETIFQEGVFSRLLAKAKILDTSVTDKPQQQQQQDEVTTPQQVTSDPELLQECAEACGLAPEMIEDIYPPRPMTAYFFTTHQESGAWLIQIIFQLHNHIPSSLVCQAFEAIHDRTEAFRSRFIITKNDQVQTVVTKSAVEWNHSTSLSTYKSLDRSQKVRAGDPVVRYALIREPPPPDPLNSTTGEEGKTYVVWTALHSAMDGWTRRLLCDDLSAYLAGPAAFLQKPRRPGMKKHQLFMSTMDPAPSRAFWAHYLLDLPVRGPIKGAVPLTAGPQQPVCNRKIIRDFPFATSSSSAVGAGGGAGSSTSSSSSAFRKSTLAHAAFGILLGTLTSSTSVLFTGVRASRTLFPGADQIMGLIFSAVPILIRFSFSQPLHHLLSTIQNDSNAMMRHEPFGDEALYMAQNATRGREENYSLVFQWYPRGADLMERRMVLEGGSGEEGRDGGAGAGAGAGSKGEELEGEKGELRVIEEKYSPHTIPGGLHAYDNGHFFRVQSEFDDRIFPAELIETLISRFAKLFERMRCAEGNETVGSLLAELED